MYSIFTARLEPGESPERMMATVEVRNVLFHGEIIEEYPEDVRGHSCLMLGNGAENRPIHVVCAPKDDYLAIITAYLSDPAKREVDWHTRKTRSEDQ
jgi:hypothetical protein